ncbi:LOW QUALITY PROTEIN: hypothetical protein QYF61_016146, partial [Mycteria americana]
MSRSATSTRFLNSFRDGDSTTSLGSLFQCLTTLSVKKFFLISNLNLAWHNLRPFPLILSLVTWEKRPTPTSLPNLLSVVESDKVSPEPPLLQAKQPQFPQPLLIRLLLQTLHQLRCPSLDTLQHLNVSLVVRGPKLNTVFKVRPHQCRVQGHDHFSSPAGHTIPDTSQDAIGFLGHLGTLLAHIQPAVNQHPQVLFLWAAFQPLFPKPVVLHGVVVAQVQDLALDRVEPHTIGLGPSIQPVQVPLQSLPTLKHIDTPAQFGVLCKLTEGTLNPLIQIIDKEIKKDWPPKLSPGEHCLTDFAFIFVKPHAIPVILIFQPPEVSLHGGSFFQCICLSSLFGVIHKLGEGAFNIIFQTINISASSPPVGAPSVRSLSYQLAIKDLVRDHVGHLAKAHT